MRKNLAPAMQRRGRDGMRTVLGPLTSVLGRPLAFLLRLSARRAGLGLVYHRIGDPPGDPDRELLPARGTAQFESELRHLKKRYRVVPASRLLEAAGARRRGERFPLSITFDDDDSSHVDVAMPILQRHGLPATFFVCGASLNGPFIFWWESLQAAFDSGKAEEAVSVIATATGSDGATQPPDIHAVASRIENMDAGERDAVSAGLRELAGQEDRSGMRAEQLRVLASHGFEIGFHTRRHDKLPLLGDDELRSAMTDGRDEVARVIGEEMMLISYPHGSADARVAEAARAAGYRLGFTAGSGAATATSNPFLVGRVGPTIRSPSRAALQLALTLLSLPASYGSRTAR
jgi:peptidoglycan/xylan/chitin deacetylase (PgdA/CDA1 family)